MYKIKSLFIFLILILSLNYCNAQSISVKMTETLVIGDDENLPSEYLFHRINHVCTDNNNNIYISQKTSSKIRVFNKNGKLIASIGKKGQGPGEFLDVTSMAIAKNNDLIVVDRMNKRITRFSNLGIKFETYELVEKHHIDPWNILPLNSNLFIINYLKKTNYNLGVTEDDKILHIYDTAFNLIKSLASASDIWDFNQPFLKSMARTWFLRLCVADSNKIIIAPGFYDGQLLIYEKQNKVWNLRRISGKKLKHKSYKLLDPSGYPNRKYPPNFMKTSSSLGGFLVVKQNLSMGLFVLNNGRIIHFIFTQKNNKVKNYVELFDKNAVYIGNSTIDETINVLWKDKDDNFYGKTYSNEGFPIIKVFKLNFDY